MSFWAAAAWACTALDEGGWPRLSREVAARVRYKLFPELMPPPESPPKNRQLIDLCYIAEHEGTPMAPNRLDRDFDPGCLRINWVVPPFGVGSGGHMTISRMIKHLEELGHENRLYIFSSDPIEQTPEEIRSLIHRHFLPLEASVHIGTENMVDSDIVFATSWQTAYPVRQVANALLKAYFVQDFEPDFYPKGSEWYFAEATYRFGYFHVTAGPWLTKKLRDEYGAEADYFPLSCDLDTYYPAKLSPSDGQFRVFYYARPVTPRRCFELGMLALEQFYRRHPGQLEVVTAGWDVDDYELPFPCTSHGVVSREQLAALYNSVDVVLVNSATNCSLLPMEVAACRTPLIDLAVPNVAGTLEHGRNAILAPPTPSGIANALDALYLDPERGQALVDRAYQHAVSQPTWAQGAKLIEQALLRQLRSQRVAAS
jgi:glycosyltransferase involved in cell wall biosynthesis